MFVVHNYLLEVRCSVDEVGRRVVVVTVSDVTIDVIDLSLLVERWYDKIIGAVKRSKNKRVWGDLERSERGAIDGLLNDGQHKTPRIVVCDAIGNERAQKPFDCLDPAFYNAIR